MRVSWRFSSISKMINTITWFRNIALEVSCSSALKMWVHSQRKLQRITWNRFSQRFRTATWITSCIVTWNQRIFSSTQNPRIATLKLSISVRQPSSIRLKSSPNELARPSTLHQKSLLKNPTTKSVMCGHLELSCTSYYAGKHTINPTITFPLIYYML